MNSLPNHFAVKYLELFFLKWILSPSFSQVSMKVSFSPALSHLMFLTSILCSALRLFTNDWSLSFNFNLFLKIYIHFIFIIWLTVNSQNFPPSRLVALTELILKQIHSPSFDAWSTSFEMLACLALPMVQSSHFSTLPVTQSFILFAITLTHSSCACPNFPCSSL